MGQKSCFGIVYALYGVVINLSLLHFSDQFGMAWLKEAIVDEVVSWNGDQCNWNINPSEAQMIRI